MNSRRSFLRMLGLGTVAAPVVAKAVQAEAAPLSAVAVNAKYRRELDILEAQRAYNRWKSAHLRGVDHTHTITPVADPMLTHSISYESADDYRAYVEWARRARL